MENLSFILLRFLNAVEHDSRIGASHVSLFCALLRQAAGSDNYSIQVKSEDVMKAAKISGLGTYHKCIRQLHDYRYIRYSPSFNHRKKSKVDFINT